MIFSLLFPLILLSAIGYVFVKAKLIKSNWTKGSADLTTQLLIPCLLFLGMYENGLPKDASLPLLLSYFLPFALHFFLLSLMLRKNHMKAQYSFAASYSNTVFVGIPVVIQVLGEGGLQFAFPIIAFHSLIGFTLYYLTDAAAGGLKNIQAAFLRTLRNPLVFSLLLGLFANSLGLRLPTLFTDSLAMLSQAALPCALLVLGASLAQFKVASQKEALLIVVGKLLFLPLLALIASKFIFQLPQDAQIVVLILACCPVGINAYILAQSDEKGVEVVSSVILVSSLLFIVTLPAWLWITQFS